MTAFPEGWTPTSVVTTPVFVNVTHRGSCGHAYVYTIVLLNKLAFFKKAILNDAHQFQWAILVQILTKINEIYIVSMATQLYLYHDVSTESLKLSSDDERFISTNRKLIRY